MQHPAELLSSFWGGEGDETGAIEYVTPLKLAMANCENLRLVTLSPTKNHLSKKWVVGFFFGNGCERAVAGAKQGVGREG
jgi:hypothetical protein